MAGNADFINILRDIRGSAAPGQPATDGIWYELTIADKNGNPGIYGDILAKYGVVTESAGTFDQAVAILENLNVEVTTLPAGSQATSALVNGVWQIGIPRGINGINGTDGSTPELTMTYDSGNIKYTVTVDGVIVTNTNLINLDTLVNSKVSTNVDVQETIEAKQEVLDAVATAQGISDSLDANVITKKEEIATYTSTKIEEINTQVELEKTKLDTHATSKVSEYSSNALSKLNQYNDNHTSKLSIYNTNYSMKINQYNENHIERLNEINYAYADRIVEMIKTRNFMGIMDEYVAQTDTHMIMFLDTTDANYIYYANGILLVENVDYTVYDSTTIELTVKANPYDVIVQVNTQVLNDMLIAEGVLFRDRIGQPNGIAGLDENGQVPSAQLPSYVDDVIEVAKYADLPATGESGKIYVVVTDENNGGDTSSYRWAGTVYAMVSNTLTAADVKALYEANANTNAYTDASVTKLDVDTALITTATTLPTAINELVSVKVDKIVGSSLVPDTKVSLYDSHIIDTTNPHGVTKAQVGLSNVDNTSDATKNVLSATKLTTAREIAFTGDVTGTVNFDGSVDVSITTAVGDNSHSHGDSTITDVAWSKVSGKPDPVVTVTLQGDVTGTANATMTDMGNATITVTTAVAANSVALGTDTTGNYVADVTAGTYVTKSGTAGEGWSPTINVDATSTNTASKVVARDASGNFAAGTITATLTGNAATATKLATARNISLSGDVSGTVSFDGSNAVNMTTTVADDSHLHAFTNLTSKPTTISGYGITDAQPLDATLTALAGVTTSANKYIYATASDTFTTGIITSFGRSLVDDDNATTARTTLGISATNTPSTAVGGISATNVQGAINEIDGNLNNLSQGLNDLNSAVVHKTGNETIAGVKTLADGLKLQGQNVSPFSGFKNYIINGKKAVNQRGLTSTDNSYNQDRWYKSGLNWYQGIEGGNNLISGKTYTLSWVGAATASYYVGTATSSTINAQSFTAIANCGSFTLTISAGQNLWIKFASDATGSTFNFVQLEEGSVATPFENRPYGLELSLCQRYYEILRNDGAFLTVGAGGFNSVNTIRAYGKVNTKRVRPSVVVVGSYRIMGLSYQGNGISSLTIEALSNGVYTVNATTNESFQANLPVCIESSDNCNNSYIEFIAEL